MMNTSKRKQRRIRLGIAAVLALVLLVSVAVVLVIANAPEAVQADTMTVTLDGKVNLVFKYGDEKVKAETVSYTAVVGEKEIAGLKSEKVGDKNVVSVPLMPYEMTETVSLYQVAEDGTKLAVSTGSVREYAEKVLAEKDFAEYHNSVRALLNYGAMTQVDVGSASNLANANVFVRNNPIDIIKKVPFGTLADKKIEEGFAGEVSVGLVFKNGDIVLRYTVTGVASAPTVSITYGDNNINGTFAEKEGAYTFDISNVGVNTFNTVWNVTITADGKTAEYHNTVLQYLNYIVTDKDTPDAEKDVARSLYQLYQNTQNKLAAADCAHTNSGYYIPADATSSYLMCAACGNKIQDAAIKNNVTAYLSGAHLSAVSTESEGIVERGVNSDGKYEIRFTGDGTMQHIWLREQYIVQPADSQTAWLGAVSGWWANTSFDIGDAQYVVVRYKWSNRTSDTGIVLSLGSDAWTWENTGYINDDKQFVAIGDGQKNQGGVYSETRFLAGDGSDYVTYVIPLKEFGKKVAATEDGNRAIDSMKITINGKAGDVLNIDYIAFVKDWKGEGALVDNTVLMSNKLNGKDVNALTKTGECAGACVNTNGDKVCDICGKAVASTYVLNGSTLNKLNVANRGFLSVTGSGTVKVDRKDKDAALYLVKSKADIENTDIGTKFDVGNAEYIVIKYKANSTRDSGDNFRLVVSTTGKKSDAPYAGGTNNIFNGLSSIRIQPNANDKTNEWVYMVIDAPAALLGCDNKPVYVKDPETNTYILDCFYIEAIQFENEAANFEIGYVAFTETLAEIDALIANETEVNSVTYLQKAYNATKYGVNPGTNTTASETVTDGVIQHNKLIEVVDGVKKVVCKGGCGLTFEEVNTSGVNAYLNVNSIKTGDAWSGGGSATNTTEKFADGLPYAKMTCKDTQDGYIQVWLRERYKAGAAVTEVKDGEGNVTGYEMTPAGGGVEKLTPANTNGIIIRPATDYTSTYEGKPLTVHNPALSVLSIGQSKYMVIRVKTEFDSIRIGLGTEAEKLPFGGSGTVCEDNVIYTSNEWTTYVVDLSVYTRFKANDDGNYYLDTFQLTAIATDKVYAKKTLSLDYIAFVDDWKTCSAIIKDDTVKLVKSLDGKAVYEMNKNGTCLQHPAIVETKTTDDAGTTYTYTCNECKTVVSSKVVPHTTNKFLSGTVLNSGLKDTFSVGTYKIVDGVLRLETTKTSEWAAECIWLREKYWLTSGAEPSSSHNFNGQGNIDAGTAKYMILKIKSNASAGINIDLGTTGWTLNDYTVASNQAGIFQTITLNTSQDGNWAVYVIDLDKFGDKVRLDKDGKRIIDSFKMVTSKAIPIGEYIDIAYVAFTDTWAEMAELVDEDTVVKIVGNSAADRTVVNKADGSAVTK